MTYSDFVRMICVYGILEVLKSLVVVVVAELKYSVCCHTFIWPRDKEWLMIMEGVRDKGRNQTERDVVLTSTTIMISY